MDELKITRPKNIVYALGTMNTFECAIFQRLIHTVETLQCKRRAHKPYCNFQDQ